MIRLRRGFPGGGGEFTSTRLHVDGNVGDRDRDRAKEGSTFLEPLDECRRRRAIGPGDGKVQSNGVEQCHVGPCLTRTIDHAVDGDAGGTDLHVRVARDDLDQFHAAGRDRRQEEFRWRQFFAGASVLYRPVDDEMMRARIAQHAPEDIRRSRRDVVLANRSCGSGHDSGPGAWGWGPGCVYSSLVKLTAWCRLFRLDTSGCNIGAKIVLASHRIPE